MARRSAQKRSRNPNAPKRGKTAWNLFFTEHRDDVKKENPALNIHEIQKKISEMWQQCNEETKHQYLKQQQANQIEYEEKLARYKEEQKNKRSQSKKKNNQGGQTKKSSNNDSNNIETNNE
ncbi:unnamed protein product [Adineta ricciae]|uniref:HMG box domain-containing protein n=1 Tax=Adineta ricciae TaxID=249248 RepID=A0A813P5N1_ADIRI|nr:unnamed protein product [Adineta ricciae]CAF0770631.1 unnamed protein product [Adineta ricciae]